MNSAPFWCIYSCCNDLGSKQLWFGKALERNKEILRDLESLSLLDSLLCKNFLILTPRLASLKSSTMGPTRVVQGAGRPPLGMPCYIEASPLTCLTPSFLILFPCFSQIQISNLNFKFSIKI